MLKAMRLDRGCLWIKVQGNFKYGLTGSFLHEKAIVHIFRKQKFALLWQYMQWMQLCQLCTLDFLYVDCCDGKVFQELSQMSLFENLRSLGLVSIDIYLGFNQMPVYGNNSDNLYYWYSIYCAMQSAEPFTLYSQCTQDDLKAILGLHFFLG